MVILRNQNKITDFLLILAWACPFNEDSSIAYKKVLFFKFEEADEAEEIYMHSSA